MSTNKNQNRILGTILLLTMLLSLLFPTSTVFADDTTPPADTSEAVDAPAEEDAPPEEEAPAETEEPVEEEPVVEEAATEEPVVEETATEEPAFEETATEEPATDETATEEPAVEEPATEEAVTEEPAVEDPAPEGEAQAEEEPVLTQLPEGTDVVVLDEEGEVVSLATQEAADAIATSDPIWCPDGVDPIANTGGCTDSYSSMTDLLAALSGGGQPTQNGTIWIDKTYDSSTAEPGGTTVINIDGGAYSAWRDYSLTIQGGWDGAGTNTISGTSLFSGDRLRIVNWRNNITINDIVFDSASGGAGLEVEVDTPSTNNFNVTFENVEVKNNTNSVGAYIDNDESTGSVTVNNSTFTNNGDNDNGLEIRAMGNVSLFNIIATDNGRRGVQISNTASSTSATVQVLGTNVFTGNNGDGLYIRSDGNITLNDITADGNNDNGIDIDNTPSSTNATFTLTGTNSFSGNTNNGANVLSEGAITLSNITANGNTNGTGAYFRNDYTGAVGGVSLTGVNLFNGNYNSGLVIDTRGAVSLANVTADGNIRGNGVNIDNCSWGGNTLGCQGSGDVTLTGNLVFTNNGNGGDNGLYIRSNGNVSMADVKATDNNGDGVEIDNTNNPRYGISTTTATVDISGTNTFTGNTSTGLRIFSQGDVSLNNVTAEDNGYGTYIENYNSTTNAVVTLTGANNFSNNTNDGLSVRSRGAITMSNVTANGNANGNTSGTGAYLRNDYTGAVGGVTVTGTNHFSGNDASGLVIDSRGAVSLTNITADSNIYGNGVNIENCNYSSGVCQGSGDVTLDGTLIFTNNGDNDDGLVISTSGNVSMADVTATGNGDEGVQIGNTNSTTNATVEIGGTNVFTGNKGDGLYIRSKGSISLNNITADTNNDDGGDIDNCISYRGVCLGNGDVTMTGNNSFTGNTSDGLVVSSSGAIELWNIAASGNANGTGANLVNDFTGTTGTVIIHGANSFNSNYNSGLVIDSRGAVSLANVTADSNVRGSGVYIENCNYSSGACQGSGNVTLTGTLVFTNNGNGGDRGLYVSTSGNVSMSDVTATGNDGFGVYVYNTRSTTNGSVQIGGTNVFTGNVGTGLYVESKGAISLSNATANGSVNDSGVYLRNNQSGAVGDVTVTGTNSFSGNNDYGLQVYSRGAVSLDNVTADGNKTQDGVFIDNHTGTGDVTLTGTQTFTNNGNDGNDDGLYVRSKGKVTLASVIATGNKDEGVEISNTDSTTNASVQISGINNFTGNTGNGLYVTSRGAITLSNVTADGSVNDGGAYLNNNQTGAVGDVTVTGTNSFSGNNDYGLRVYSRGGVSLSNVTADGNKTQDGAYIDNDAGTGDVTITGTNSFSGNGNGDGDDGLYITSQGNVALENVTADGNVNYGAYIDNRSSSSGANVTIDGNPFSNTAVNSFSNNGDDGLTIYSDGTISLFNVAADGNGAGTADNGAELNNRSGNGDVLITGYHNSFSNNAGPGLDIDTRGDIEVHFATINNNNLAGGANGAQFNASGSAKVYCSVFDNNSGVGLNASSVNGSLDFYGMDGFSDYSYNGTAGFNADDCFVPVYGCTDPHALNYDENANADDGTCVPRIYGCTDPTHPNYDPLANTMGGCEEEQPQLLTSYLIPVTGGQLIAISCETPMTKLLMANGDYVIFSDLCGYDALMDEVPEAGLPDGLPDGGQYVSGFNVAVTEDGVTTEPLPIGTSMTVAFTIPAGMESESFTILRWDGSEWVEESASVEDGYVRATTSHTGTFVLVVQ